MAGKLADVAKQAGVSEATVSRVLKGKPGIADATRAAVLTALDVIGYELFPGRAEVVAGALAQRGFNARTPSRARSGSPSWRRLPS